MCGIYGKVNFKGSIINEKEALCSALNTLFHRGPDGGDYWFGEDEKIFFGHRRLSIIDLSEKASQPMHDGNGNVIVFNGEIYNYKELRQELLNEGHHFNTSSDTEVLLHAYTQYGLDFVSKLNGMFAFCLYDKNQKKLLLARDRAGEKPLFYSLIGDEFVFASELKAILSDTKFEKNIDHDALDCYLAFGFIPGERCILKNVNKLAPGSMLLVDIQESRAETLKYWKLPEYNISNGNLKVDDLQLEFENLLQDAVSKQLVADVPVGILLSGGVDSSLITALAVRSKENVKTFNIGFPGYKQYDETDHARLIAKHFGTEHIELQASEITVDFLESLARQYDEPITDSSMIPTFMVSKLIRAHCTVALGGDGGDELFGGYGHYNRLLWLKNKAGWLPGSIRAPIVKTLTSLMPVGMKGRNWIQGFGENFGSGLPLIASYFDRGSREKLLKSKYSGNSHLQGFPAENIRSQRIPLTSDLLQRATRMDFENYLPEDILVKVDRASMMNSLEIRAPFLDHRIIEFAFSKVPSSLKATSTEKKILLKRLCGKILPPEFDKARKQGFSIPLASWLKEGPWLEYFKEVLLDRDSPFDRKFIEKLFSDQQRGFSNSERLFSLVLLELWRKSYGINF